MDYYHLPRYFYSLWQGIIMEYYINEVNKSDCDGEADRSLNDENKINQMIMLMIN